ncbi:HAD-IA family hydrolase [Paenibacillus sp. CC-CFT747]|nr:HAD-IA family hydrolase [Paenibacillus sp. CC-CFT747]
MRHGLCSKAAYGLQGGVLRCGGYADDDSRRPSDHEAISRPAFFPPGGGRDRGLFHEAFQLFYYGKQLNPDEVCSPESDRQFWIQLYRFILDRLGAEEEWTEDEIHACCHEMYDVFTAPEQYQLFEDVEESLEAFSKRGLRLGVISNFAPTLRHILEAKGILSYFDPVIVSTEVGIEKPNPSIFRLALEEAGLEAKDVLYIGDHEHNDLWAPAQVGIDAVKIKRYDYMEGEGIRSLLELL